MHYHTERVHEGKKIEPKICEVCPYKCFDKKELEFHTVVKHELKINSIDETNVDKICENPNLAAVFKKKYKKKELCKLCEINVYGKHNHILEHHKVSLF